jgi:ABC-2 type transport system permease protein
MAKQLTRVRTYVALAILVALPILMTIALRYGERRRGEGGDIVFQLARDSGLVMPAAALFFMSHFLLVVVVAIFAGDSVAGEASWGNLRYVLVRPIGRARLLTAKLAMAAVFTIIATVLIVITGLIAGGIAFGWHGINIGLFFNGSFYSLNESVGQLMWHLATITLYVIWGMAAAVTLSFMVSTMTDAAVGAMSAGIGLYVISQILDAIPQLGAIRYGLPTHYLDDWRGLIVNNQADADLIRGVLLQVPYVVVFLGVAFWWFRRKDITS